jgi:magnesium transporter
MAGGRVRDRLRDRWRILAGQRDDVGGSSFADRAIPSPRPGVVTCAVYVHGRRVPGDVELRGAAQRCVEGFAWIDLTEPNADDIAAVAAEFSLPPLAVADAIAAHQRPKLEVHGNLVLLVLKPVHYVDREEVVEVTEVAMFLGNNFIVTVRHGDTRVLTDLREHFDEHGLEHHHWGPTEIAQRAASSVVDGYEKAIDFILEDVDEIEEQVFAGGEDDRSQRIYKLKREVAEFRRAVSPLGRTLERMAESATPALHPEASPYFHGAHERLLRAAEGVEAIDRLLTDVFQANVAQVSAAQARIAVQQNEDMRKISAWAAIGLVPTGVAGIYGMNFHHMPELGWRLGYPMALSVIGVICLGLYRTFRRSGWL